MPFATAVNSALRPMSRDIFKAPPRRINHMRTIGEHNQEKEERGNSVEAEDMRARLKQAEDSIRQRDDEIYYLNEEIRQLQNQNEEERLERYKEFAGPLPQTAEVVQALEASNDRGMRQLFGRKGAKNFQQQQSEPASRQKARKSLSSKATTSEPAPSIVARPSTSSSSSRGLGDFTRKAEGLKRIKGESEEAPPAKSGPGRPSSFRTLAGEARYLISESIAVVGNGNLANKIVITIDSDSGPESH
ncbi:hypothetical protein DL98DRAFT_597403 [Cadophora sp. DSE1049]|nr:hypothetical protein DL98DRAFT_597403 [Cadophora sp. DSE1049]